ncbi:RNA polymerase sigma factor [Methylibium sp.]|uniref:RNA polymerase sigma factor n=1 Tax=Methylibium sp. TaxID=2067992 RepID=UPI003D0E53E2
MNPSSPPIAGTASGRVAPAAVAPGNEAGAAARCERDARLAELLCQSAAGSASAFEAFYDATFGHARALARRMVRPADLDDLLADAFFQAWREASRFDGQRASAVTWLLVIVRSRALDLLRRQRAAREVESVTDADELAGTAPGPDELLSGTQAGTQLHAALAELSPGERWVLGLAYYRDLSHSEISAVTGMALGTVKSSIRRAQEKLRKHFVPEA